MALQSTNTDPNFGMQGVDNGDLTAGNIVITYKAAASTSYSNGDFITVSTTAGTISKCSAKDSVFDGIVMADVDNSSGAAGDKLVPVLVKGFATVNGFVEATGQTEDDTITYNDLVYLSADSVGAGAGQKVTALNATSTVVGRSLDETDDAGAADQNVNLRVYINCLEKSFS